MSRRIDIELTSDKGDGTWTWRAAGARQPKGVLAADLLPEGARVGAEVRAEVEVGIDGTEVVAVLPPKEKNRAQVETIELLGRPVRDDELVTSKLAGKGRRDRGDRGDRGERRGRGDRRGRDGDSRGRRDGRGDDRRGPRSGGRGEGQHRDRPRRERTPPPSRPKPKRLRPARTHRKAALDALPAAERVIGEQVLMGGLPAVRQAVQKQNEAARAAGGREVAAEPLLAIAERLLPDLRAAEWRDRAEAALADLDELDLRDLRSVVVAADSGARDDETRALADQLRTGLAGRVEQEQATWLTEIADTLQAGRTVRALRLSSRPPKAGAPLPGDLATKLAEAASAGMTSDTAADRWATVLDALSYSPVRLTVAPASVPAEPTDELKALVAKLGDRLPLVAQAFGIEPAPRAPRRSRGKAKPKGKAPAKPKAPKPEQAPEPEPVPEPEPAPATEAPAAEATPQPEPAPGPEPVSQATAEPAAEAPAPDATGDEAGPAQT